VAESLKFNEPLVRVLVCTGSQTGLVRSTSISVKPKHWRNGAVPMLVMLPGIMTLIKLAPWNALAAMPVTGRPLVVLGMESASPGPK
jgi:hypothetical protein